MKTMVVYDSVFGNTEKIARAIGGALGSEEEVKTLRVGEATPEQLSGLDILVVGSPTRAFQATPATKIFLKNIPAGALKGVTVAAFDTRMDINQKTPAILRVMVKIFGYAAKPIADGLSKKGGRRAAEPEGFIVLDTEGPLKDGELERAARWAYELRTANK